MINDSKIENSMGTKQPRILQRLVHATTTGHRNINLSFVLINFDGF